MTTNKTNNDEIKFENQDLQIFNIQEPRLKVDTLQNYFFPRLNRLLDDTLSLANDIYGESILEDFTRSYTPNHRPSTKLPRVGDYVRIGLSGRGRKKEPLILKNRNNEPYHLTPAVLNYGLFKSGEMSVQLSLYAYGKPSQLEKNEEMAKANALATESRINDNVNSPFRKLVADIFAREEQKLQMLFIAGTVSYEPYCYDFKPLHQIASERLGDLHFYSPIYYLPIDLDRGLWSLQLAFITLMPIWYAINQLARTGEEKYFSQHLDSLVEFYKSFNVNDAGTGTNEDDESETEDATETESDVDNSLLESLDSYAYVRARKWYHILARDNWTCKSCGRCSQKDGIILHVDHIVPRSKGGTNDDDNLQTLCQKCNLGKSNLDDTNLREL